MEQRKVITESVAEPVQRIFNRVVEYLPNVLGAFLLILFGALFAWLLSLVTLRIGKFGLERFRRWKYFNTGGGDGTRYDSAPKVLSRLVFWFVLLFFVAASIEALGLRAVSSIFSDLTSYLPQVLAAALIIFSSLFLGELVRTWVGQVATRMGMALPDLIGRTFQILIWSVAAMVAIDQLGIDSTALMILLAIVVGSGFGASALAFGLGARVTVGNIISSHYVHKNFSVGSMVKIGGVEGPIFEITRTHVILETAQGRVLIPAQRFSEEVAVLMTQGSALGEA